MALFFTSDHHFGHANIIRYDERPFRDVEHMNEELVERWNAVVGPDDTVMHLGDIALGRLEQSLTYVARLNGRIFLVPGNHDRVSSVESPERRARFAPLYRAAGLEILPEQVPMTLEPGVRILACHYPPTGDTQGADRHVELRPEAGGVPIVHGHTHQRDIGDGRAVHVGVPARDWAPVRAEVVVDEILRALPSA